MSKSYDLNYIKEKIKTTIIKSINVSFSLNENQIDESDDGISISFSINYVKEHKDEVLRDIIEIIRVYDKDKFSINSSILINDDVIEALCENKRIEEINLAKTDIMNIYSLSLDTYNKFKSAGKNLINTFTVDSELKRNFDPMIGCNVNKSIYSFYTYSDFQSGLVYFNKFITDDDEYIFKYFGKDAKLIIDGNSNIKKILKFLEKYNVQSEIIIDAKNKKAVNSALIELGYLSKDGEVLKRSNLNLKFSGLSMDSNKNYSFDEYLDYESLLYKIVSSVQDLSPLEKFIYAYDIVKKFKLYNTPNKDNKNVDKMDRDSKIMIKHVSRDLYDVLENNYIVCVGFAEFLKDLLTKLGINNCGYGFDVEISHYKALKQIRNNNADYDKLSSFEKRKLLLEQQSFVPHSSYGGHERVLVHINDEKYGIDGMYFSDPTWDNELIDNSYAHCLMTEEDVSISTKKPKLDIDTLLFSATSIEEFNQMLNTCINLAIEKEKIRNKEYYGNSMTNEYSEPVIDELNIFYEFFKKFFSKLSLLFPNDCNKIRNKYFCIYSKNFNLNSLYELSDEVISMIYDVGTLIVSKQNQMISRDTLHSAIKEVYSDIYEGGLRDDEIDSFFKFTDDAQLVEFGSSRYK